MKLIVNLNEKRFNLQDWYLSTVCFKKKNNQNFLKAFIFNYLLTKGKIFQKIVNTVFSYEASRSVTVLFTKKTSVFMSLSLKMDGFSFCSDCRWLKMCSIPRNKYQYDLVMVIGILEARNPHCKNTWFNLGAQISLRVALKSYIL